MNANILEHPDTCRKCGSSMEWVDCWNGCDEGYITDLHQVDPNWYDEDYEERCDICRGKSGWYVCGNCNPQALEAE
jgi:hypothetical protein